MERRKHKKLRLLLVFLVLLLILLAAFRKPLLRQYYVRAYEEAVLDCALAYEVPPDLLCAVIWCESRFRADAESAAGACGLMQLTPATFREVLERLSLPADSNLFDPELNIRCGTFYLHHLYTLYENWEVALAAYNAGMGNVSRWLSDARYSADGKTLQEIPFAETAAYVRNVLRAQKRYQELYD